MGKEKYIVKTKRSRKSYIWIYVLMVVGLIYVLYYHFFVNGLENYQIIIGIVILLFAFKFTEYHRFREWWGMNDNALVESKGIFNKTLRSVNFIAISDFDVSQHFLKRIFGYGNINVRLYSDEANFKIKNINHPGDFAEILQEKMEAFYKNG